MREYRDYLGPEASRPYSLGLSPAVRTLVIANVAVFFGMLIGLRIILPLFHIELKYEEFFRWVGVSYETSLKGGYVWQFVTYAFFHDPNDFWHLVFNMAGLWFLGSEIEALYGQKKFLFLYIGAAVFGGLCHCIDTNLNVPAVGASGAVYAVLVIYALHFPHQRLLFLFLIPVEAWIVVAICIGADVTAYLARGTDGIAHLAHLGGAAFGYLFFRFQGSFESYIEEMERRMAKKEQAHEEELEARLDTVLDKINREGMAALSKKEWEVLKKASKHYQRRE